MYDTATNTMTTIADSTNLPAHFDEARDPSISGDLVLVETDGPNGKGILIHKNGELHDVLRKGDEIDGMIVDSIELRNTYSLDGNLFAFNVSFVDEDRGDGPRGTYIGEIIIDCNGNGVADDIDIALGDAFDCNCNGIPDECDVMDPAMDMNGDGYVDSCTACAGDTNCDGLVNYTDLLNVFTNLGSSGPLGDVNYDSVVNILDYYIVAWNYGSVCN